MTDSDLPLSSSCAILQGSEASSSDVFVGFISCSSIKFSDFLGGSLTLLVIACLCVIFGCLTGRSYSAAFFCTLFIGYLVNVSSWAVTDVQCTLDSVFS